MALGVGANTYERLSERAARSFDWKEWSSAAAMYELMLKERPGEADTYVSAIVARQMIPDSAAAVDLVERAMSHDLGLEKILDGVRKLDFAIGQGDRYGQFLLQLRHAMPWMSRGLDHQLLNYYLFRDDGPMIVEYAKIMLAGLPESTTYLAALARGYMLQGNTEEASAAWKKIIDIQPDNYDALLWLGNYMNLAGERDRAREYLSRAMALRPTPAVKAILESLNQSKP